MASERGIRKGLINSLGVMGIAMAGGAVAQTTIEEEIVVTGRYQVPGLTGPLQTLPLADTPRSVTVIADQLLEEQGRRTLRDALRNITGISLQAGEGNPPGGGDALSIRGFSARDDIYVDGIRDTGNYFRDPFNADRIEVTKGPASAFAGRGNEGGAVNIVTRTPELGRGSSLLVSGGTDSMGRFTADWNHTLDEERGISTRLNAMMHRSDEPGRDSVRNERWGIAPAAAFGLNSDTRLVLSYLHQEQDDLPDFGLPNARNPSLAGSPFAGSAAPVDTNNFYGYSTDYRDITVDIGTLRLDHDFSDTLAVSTVLRSGRTHNDSIMSAPRFTAGGLTTIDNTTSIVGTQKPRNQTDEILVSQTSLTWNLETGVLVHTLVAGLELAREESRNLRRHDANGPAMNLFNPVLQAAPAIPYNGTSVQLDMDTNAIFIFDTVEIGEQWRVIGGLRRDEVKSAVLSADPDNVAPASFDVDLARTDREWSSNLGLVYKPVDNTSAYVAFSTSFEPSGRAEVVQLAGGNFNAPVSAASFDADPERSEAWEAGLKWAGLEGRLELAAAVFRITKTDARTPGVNPGDPAIVLDGEQRVNGFEANAVGELLPGLNVFAGYTWLDGEVTASNVAAQRGQPLDNLPEHSVNLWLSYPVTRALLVGGGVQHVASRLSTIPGSGGNIDITAPAYTVTDMFVEYAWNEAATLRMNVYNLSGETYYQAFSSGQSIPAPERSAVLTLEYSF